MHSFLRAVGFDSIANNRELDKMLDNVIDMPDSIFVCKDSQDNEFAELTKEFGENIGIKVCGQFLDDDNFEMDYYYPYFTGKGISTEEKIDIERHAGNESYAGICDDVKLGVALIYYIQNVTDYLCESKHRENCLNHATVTLSGLSVNGRIIMPIEKRKKQQMEQQNQFRNHLMAAARDGDEEAIESLTLEDMDTYTMITRRVACEDILSIVESSFMPYGIESDQYAIIGEILDYHMVTNRETAEEICVMTINTSDLIFDVCINRKDLLGEPEVGRRFKGSIWLQGRINFESEI